MGFFTKKQIKLSAVAFNLNDFEELNYNQLVEVNGGCGGGFWAGVRNFFSGGKKIASRIVRNFFEKSHANQAAFCSLSHSIFCSRRVSALM